ncbi:MAG TPA: alpha/beta fold hydrolase [Kofleriaceae bacterium]|nr:alpha/beta fold hydrolase [Kofleriaceae bacterium]
MSRRFAWVCARALLVAAPLVALVIATLAVGCQQAEPGDAPRIRGVRSPKDRPGISIEGTATETVPPPTLNEMVEAGQHWRFVTAHGPVHVWTPKGYDARRAETIVYVHGFYTHVDGAWQSYELAKQFAASAINAMFIAPEAPASGQEAVSWSSLADLLAAVEQGIDQPTPKRRIVVMGHSGAWRTLIGWLDEPQIDTVVLVDAAYGEIDEYKKWVLASDKHRLIDVGDDTREWTDQLHAQLPDTVVLDRFPTLEDGIPREAQHARILYIKSNLGHFPLVTNGYSLPMILRTLRARRLVRQPLSEIIESGKPE